MLKIGNYLNGSTRRGGAYGFKIDVLKKVHIVKAIDKKSTLVDFIAETLKAQEDWEFHNPSALAAELPSLRGASSYSLSEVEKDFKIKDNYKLLTAKRLICDGKEYLSESHWEKGLDNNNKMLDGNKSLSEIELFYIYEQSQKNN